MTTKHQPAAPLPLTVAQRAAHIAHATIAYPRLVEALQIIKSHLGALEWGTDAHAALELRHLIDEEYPRIETMLRNLGETK